MKLEVELQKTARITFLEANKQETYVEAKGLKIFRSFEVRKQV